MINFSKRGFFRFTTECVENDLKGIYDTFKKINFTIFKVDFDFKTQKFIYEGTSPEFASLYEGCEIPRYDLEQFRGEKND